MADLNQPTPALADGDSLIRQIALTNQISVPWDDLRRALQLRLDQVLESSELTYTAPTVTNPLTTVLTSSSTADATLPGAIDASAFSSWSSSPAASHAHDDRVASEEEDQNVVKHGQEQGQGQQEQEHEQKQDQAHVPEQPSETEKGLEQREGQEQSEDQETRKVESGGSPSSDNTTDTGKVVSPQESITQQGDDTSSLLDSASDTSASVNGATAPSPPLPSTPAGAATTPTPASASAEADAKMIPISKNTLLVETPEGYYQRINGLLNAFISAPFTIQRVCELLSNPTEHHSNLIKYLRAVEKVLMITSSINEFSNPAYNGPSALDEDKSVENDRSSTGVNGGDYSGTRSGLDFGLITVAAPVLSDSLDNEDKDNQQQQQQLENLADTKDDENEGKGMDVEKATAGGSDMDVDTAAVESTSTMDGLESEGAEDEAGDILVGTEGEGGMELDQA